jgi:[acyl-carrier-protein] S-malonyltransferase
MKRAFVFPGQGSQAVGMGRALAAAFAPARQLFEEIDDALSQRLSLLMFEGPESDLTLTENAQPALMAASLAVIEVLETMSGVTLARHATFVAVSVCDGARLVKLRGQAMQQAVPVGEGAMAALLGLDVEEARAVAAAASCGAADRREVCAVANDNAPGQVVISGHRAAVERAIAIARLCGARRAIALPVSAPFHSPLMAPAAKTMEKALGEVVLRAPVVPLVANVTATFTRDPAAIRGGLVEQVTAMVRWRESILSLKAAGIEEVIEIGAGRVLAGLVKRIAPELTARSVGTAAEVEAVIKEF